MYGHRKCCARQVSSGTHRYSKASILGEHARPAVSAGVCVFVRVILREESQRHVGDVNYFVLLRGTEM